MKQAKGQELQEIKGQKVPGLSPEDEEILAELLLQVINFQKGSFLKYVLHFISQFLS